MLIAETGDGTLDIARQTGHRGRCPECGGVVWAKVGGILIPHWAHEPDHPRPCSRRDGKGVWHETWQLRAYTRHGCQIEVPMTGEDGTKRRADIVTPRGLVIELQTQPLPIPEAAARERFYHTNTPQGMIWVAKQPDSAERSQRWFNWTRPDLKYARLDARTYWNSSYDDETHAVTFATRWTEDEELGEPRERITALAGTTWPDGGRFLEHMTAWDDRHLRQGGQWRSGVWARS